MQAHRLLVAGDHEAALVTAHSAIHSALLALHHYSAPGPDGDPIDDVVGAYNLVRELALSSPNFEGVLRAQQYVDDALDGGTTLARLYGISKEEVVELIVVIYAGAVIGTIRTYLLGNNDGRYHTHFGDG